MASGERDPVRKWEAERESVRRREWRLRLAASLFVHVALGVALAFGPAAARPPAPRVIDVDLVRMAPAPRAAPKPAPPAPTPAPQAVPKPAPVPKKVLLPKEPAPLPAKPKKVVRKRPRPQELDYDDALARLRSRLGEQQPDPKVEEPPADEPIPGPEMRSGGGSIDPETAAWILATKRHVRSVWITPQEFLDRGLSTELRVLLTIDGNVVGRPEVVRSSGDPFWDDNAVRAILRASPLPPPPDAGEWDFSFAPEERG